VTYNVSYSSESRTIIERARRLIDESRGRIRAALEVQAKNERVLISTEQRISDSLTSVLELSAIADGLPPLHLVR
jgi:hypothetical protein